MLFAVLFAVFLPVIPQPRAASLEAGLGDEGYRIEISNGVPIVSSGTEQGRRWARKTLAQLRKSGPLKDGVIVDSPKYRMRGLMLDVGRKYVPLDYLRKLVVEMSDYKLNTLHLHLSDNEIVGKGDDDWSAKYAAFRLECESCSRLTARDGAYSKSEFRAFMKFAVKNGVTIVPEIDVPAHSLAFTRVRPEFASKKYGEDHFDLDRMPEILPWLESIFSEYMKGDDPVFVGPYCHIGTDEYNKKDAEKFRAFTDAMMRMVMKYGYRPCAWGALSHAQGGTPVCAGRDIVLDIWHNPYHHPLQAIGEGYSIVSIPDDLVYIVPKAGYYYDYLDVRSLYESWEPNVFGKTVIPWDHPQLMGGKFAVWCDKFDKITVDDLAARITHAIPVMAQKMWSGKVEGQPFDDFERIRICLQE